MIGYFSLETKWCITIQFICQTKNCDLNNKNCIFFTFKRSSSVYSHKTVDGRMYVDGNFQGALPVMRSHLTLFILQYTARPYAHSSSIALLTQWCRVLLEKLTGLQLLKKFPAFTRNPKVHHRTHKRPPPVSILGQPNPVYIPTSNLLEIHPNIHPSTPRSPQWSPSLLFPHQDPIHPLSSPIRATCPAHLILLDFIIRTILGEEYKSFSSLRFKNDFYDLCFIRCLLFHLLKTQEVTWTS